MSDSALPMKRALENGNDDEPVTKVQKTEIESQKPIEALKDATVESVQPTDAPSVSESAQEKESEEVQISEEVSTKSDFVCEPMKAEIETDEPEKHTETKSDGTTTESMNVEIAANESEKNTEMKTDEAARELMKVDEAEKELPGNDNVEFQGEMKTETANSETVSEPMKADEAQKELPEKDNAESSSGMKAETEGAKSGEIDKSSQESKIKTKEAEDVEKSEKKKDESTEKEKKLLHTKANVHGNRFYVGETCLAKYPLDEFHYECTIKSIDEDGMGVEFTWFNGNPEHTKAKIDLLDKADSDTIYVGEKIWAKYTDGQLYEATVEKINFTESGETESFEVTWFNDNPEHRVIKRDGVEKMTDLDFQERFEDPKLRENDERKEAVDLKKDAETDIKEVLKKEYGIKI